MQCNMFKRQHVSNKKKKVAEIKNSFSSVHNVELGNLMKEEEIQAQRRAAADRSRHTI